MNTARTVGYLITAVGLGLIALANDSVSSPLTDAAWSDCGCHNCEAKARKDGKA